MGMELGLVQQAQKERTEQLEVFKVENERLKRDLLHSQAELRESLTEALKLLSDIEAEEVKKAD